MHDNRLFTPQFAFTFASFFFQGVSFAVFLHLSGFLRDLGASELTIGALLGFASIGAVFLRLGLAVAIDRFGRRPLILAGHVVNIASVALHLTLSTIGPLVVLVTVLHTVAEALLMTTMLVHAADVIPVGRRTEGISIFGVAGQSSIAIGGLIGDFVLSRYGFSGLWIIASGIAGVGLITALPLRDQRPTSEAPDPRGAFDLLRSRRLRPIWATTLMFSIVLVGFFVFVRTFVDDVGIGSVGMFFSAYSGTAILLRVTGRRLPAQLGESRMLAAALLTLAVGTALLGAATTDAGVVLAGVFAGAGHGFVFPILNSLTVSRSPDRNRGAGLGIFSAIFPLGIIIGGPLVGYLIERFGYRTSYFTLAVIAATTALIFGQWDRRVSEPTVTDGTGAIKQKHP
ncbi:MAG: MFS transporter [Acidimicrobiia bacterium]|nr:MFS transporter [Acidimicrobiia bacterium]